jgi:hypothetical protein
MSMSSNQKVIVLEVVGGYEQLQSQIQAAIDTLSPAPSSRVPVTVTTSGQPPRFTVIITYIPETPLEVISMYQQDLTIATTHDTPSEVIDVQGLDSTTIYLKATGEADAQGSVTFYISFSGDGTSFSTTGTPLTLTVSGEGDVISEPYLMDLRGVKALRVTKVVNSTGKAVSGANALLTRAAQ